MSEANDLFPEVVPTPGEEGCEDFDWRDDEVVVVHLQPRTAVYENCRRQVVIRQEATHPQLADNDDQFVFFSREHLPALIARLAALLKDDLS